MTYKEFANTLKMYRFDKGLRQIDVATLIPCSRIRYNRIETGKCEPTFYELRRLAEILDINLNIITEKKPKNTMYFD